MFQSLFLWKSAYRLMAFRKLRLCSGPNIGSDAKDTNSEEVVRGVPKTVGDFIQGLRFS